MADLNFIYVTGLAVTDAINPCELAVLVMVLMALLLRDPTKRRNILLGGLAFSSAVFILYFLYGLILVQFFKHLIPASGVVALYVSKGFGLLAIILGLLNIRDYLDYEPGRVATEMPLSFRPRVKMLINKINSPLGAFVTGAFVTVFLLPCTAGPYLIVSEKISTATFMKTLLWLIYYNVLFILPMLIITFAIYFGVTTVGRVSDWREQNIKKLHLWEGIILILLGIAIFTRLI